MFNRALKTWFYANNNSWKAESRWKVERRRREKLRRLTSTVKKDSIFHWFGHQWPLWKFQLCKKFCIARRLRLEMGRWRRRRGAAPGIKPPAHSGGGGSSATLDIKLPAHSGGGSSTKEISTPGRSIGQRRGRKLMSNKCSKPVELLAQWHHVVMK